MSAYCARSTILMLGLLTGCAATATPVLTPGHAVAITDSARATMAEYVKWMNARDVDALMRLYVDDGRFSWVADGQVQSLTSIRNGIESAAGYSRVHLEYTDTKVTPLAPGVASVTTRYTMSLGDSATGFTFGGAITMNLIHTTTGWKLLDGHSSSPRAAAN